MCVQMSVCGAHMNACYMFVCVYVHVHGYVIHACVYVDVNVTMEVSVLCILVCASVCVCSSMHMFTCKCVCMCLQVQGHTCSGMHRGQRTALKLDPSLPPGLRLSVFFVVVCTCLCQAGWLTSSYMK